MRIVPVTMPSGGGARWVLRSFAVALLQECAWLLVVSGTGSSRVQPVITRLRASLDRHQLVALYLAIALGAFVVLVVVMHESPQRALLIAIPLGVAALALAFASSWFSPPLAREHGPMRLPPLQALARTRHRLNPFFVEHVTLRSPYRPEWCRTELARVLLPAPYIPGPAGAMTGLLAGERFTLRRVTLWHDGGRPLASGTLEDAEPGTWIRIRVAPPAAAIYVGFVMAVWIGGIMLIALIAGLQSQPLVTLLALAAIAVATLLFIAVGGAIKRLAEMFGVRFVDTPESDRIVQFLRETLAADIVSRD